MHHKFWKSLNHRSMDLISLKNKYQNKSRMHLHFRVPRTKTFHKLLKISKRRALFKENYNSTILRAIPQTKAQLLVWVQERIQQFLLSRWELHRCSIKDRTPVNHRFKYSRIFRITFRWLKMALVKAR